MAGLEGCPCSVLEEAAESAGRLQLVVEAMTGLEGGLWSMMEEAAGSACRL